MKTNQVMIRQMASFRVEQRTKDGFFNATSLIKQWNEEKAMKKEIKDYLENKSTEEFIKALIVEENLNKGNYPYLSSRGKNGGTWMHPLLFIDFAMWLNPSFKVKVLKFVQDEMIKFRHLAGESYPEMCKAVDSIIEDKNKLKDAICKIAKSINIIVYGKHECLVRNNIGEAEKIRELFELQKNVATWINIGLVKTFDQLKTALTNLYLQKYPNVLNL